jgi:PAS domain S-box-containing protein
MGQSNLQLLVGRAMPQRKPLPPNILPAIRRYGLAVVSVALAFLLTLVMQHYEFRHVVLAPFLLAIALTAWYGGVGPAALSIVLSSICFVYFFAPPIHSLAFTVTDVPAIVILVCFGVLITGFSAVRRRIEGQLLQARDELQADINDRMKAEEKLRRSEGYLAESQRLTKTGSWAYNPFTGRTLYWSDEMFRIFGLDPQEGPSSDKFRQLVHPEDRDRVRKRVEREAHQKTGYLDEYRMVLLDGMVKHILEIGHPVFSEAGDVIEFVGTTVDVTERKRAEETLRRSEAYLSEAQSLTHTGSWAWDPIADKVLYWSEEMFRIFGFDPHGVIPTGLEFGQRIHPDDHDWVFKYVESSVRQTMNYVVNHRIVLPDGTLRQIETIGHPAFDSTGGLVEYVGTAMDITDRKRAEEELHAAETRFRASVDHLTDALFIHDDQDDQGRVIDVNQQTCDSLGYAREELIGMTASDYDAVLDAAAMTSVKERLARGEIFSFESAHRRKDGTVFPVEVRVRPFWHGDHRFGLAVVRDITDRKRSEQERERLRQLEADIAHINRVSMMGELAASFAHEIKQPIAAAATNAKTSLRWLQREPPVIDEARETVSRMIKDVIRAAEIIDRNRALYRRDKPKQETVELNELIEEMIALQHDAASRHLISIRAELDGALPTMAADRVQMQQVLMNLMLNGIEAMKETGGELTIRSAKTEDGQILVSVSDLGIGLPEQTVDQIFNAFFTTKAHGTGMGLSISRRIIESHGGRLWATGNSGRGATFHFMVPTEVKADETTLRRTGS